VRLKTEFSFQVPLNEMFGYSSDLRSTTQGKGEYSMEFSRYSPAKPELQERLILQYQESQGVTPSNQKRKKN